MNYKCQLFSEVCAKYRNSGVVHRSDVKQAVDLLYSVKYHYKRFSTHGTCNEKLLINNIVTAINVIGCSTMSEHVNVAFETEVVEFYYSVLEFINCNTGSMSYNTVFYDYIVMNNP